VELALFAFLLAYERSADESRDPEGDRERLLEWVRERVLADPRRPGAVEEIAAERGMSRSHFSHHFRSRTGLTPARFMSEVRVQEAARALLATPAPVKRIAADWGFANSNHFGKVFRRFHHVSPAAYRRAFAV
jgi:AraC-like DNA-binding protein